MKVICISVDIDNYFKPIDLSTTKRCLGLTLNKSYEVSWIDNRWYEIINDDGIKTFYDKEMFVNLAEWRNRQIDSILED
jgi:hypothetical protein